MLLFLVTPCLIVAVQSCMEWIPIKRKSCFLWNIIQVVICCRDLLLLSQLFASLNYVLFILSLLLTLNRFNTFLGSVVFLSSQRPFVGKKAKGWISKRVFQEKARLIGKTNISYPLIVCVSGGKKCSFSKHPFLDSPFCFTTDTFKFVLFLVSAIISL